jgi:alpha-tubulin suppressor-like RCC1 family protein
MRPFLLFRHWKEGHRPNFLLFSPLLKMKTTYSHRLLIGAAAIVLFLGSILVFAIKRQMPVPESGKPVLSQPVVAHSVGFPQKQTKQIATASDPQQQAADPHEQASGIGQSAAALPVASPVQPKQNAIVGLSSLSPKARAALEKIPESRLRSAILDLAPDARARALEYLAEHPVPEADYDSLHVAPNGAFYYVCAFTPKTNPVHAAMLNAAIRRQKENATPEIAAASSTAAASVPITQPPLRHSRPGATNVFYLDFGGSNISGTWWNEKGQPTTFYATPYDIDGNTSTFSDQEQRNIIEIWQRVAEDYAPFDVDVTTEKPVTFTRTTGHALVTSRKDRLGRTMPYADSAGGVAFLSAFGTEHYVVSGSPAFVYYDNLRSENGSIAGAISHELGHNLGLSHDGQRKAGATSVEYYRGHGSGATSWAPIMGADYDGNVSQWSKGDYYGANNFENDIAIIESKLGYKEETVATTLNNAESIYQLQDVKDVADGILGATGTILRAGDEHYYYLNLGSATTVTFNLDPWRAESGMNGGNTDLKLEILHSNGTVLVSDNPANETKASISRYLASGIWYLRVTSTGTGSPMASSPTGYTNYGSVGQYTLKTNLVFSHPALDMALDNDLIWENDEDNPADWFGQADTYYYGNDAIQSPVLGNNQSSIVYTEVTGPGTFSFWWKVSSEANYDMLTFLSAKDRNGTGLEFVASISGEKDWEYRSFTIPAGTWILGWAYRKDGSASAGRDTGWVDKVTWVPSGNRLTIDTSAKSLSASASSFGIAVQSNTRWTISDNALWLSVSPLSGGSGNGTITVTCSANTTSQPRSAKILVSCSGITRTCIVTQAATIISVPLATALDNSLTWQTGGNGTWTGQTVDSYDGTDAVRSGVIGNGQESYIQTTVTGAGTISFWWKVSSEVNYDYLRFYIDGVEQAKISGQTDWAQRSFTISGTGTHTLKWTYQKDVTISAGQDAGWLDQVTWTASPTSTRIIDLPATLSFGTLAVGSTSSKTLTIQNKGNSALTVSSINYPVGYSGNWSSGTIAAGASKDVIVTFRPTAAQSYSGNLTVNSNATSGTNTCMLAGMATTSANPVTTVAAGGLHSLYVTPNGDLYTAGYNNYGQLGDGSATYYRSTSVKVASNVTIVAGGDYHSLYVTSNGDLYAMGYNVYGQLGDGTTTDRRTPVKVASNVTTVAAGNYSSLYVTSNGDLYAMGNNSTGQLGDGTTTDRHTPVKVASNVTAVATGGFFGISHSLYVTSNGDLYAMGYNTYGQLGDGTTTHRRTPVKVASNVTTVAAGSDHSLYVTSNGDLYTMGFNSSGQLGDGTTTNRSTPVKVASNVATVAAGDVHSLYVTSNDNLYVMGRNIYGQLGDGTDTDRSTPVLIRLVAAKYTLTVNRDTTAGGTISGTSNGQYEQGANVNVTATPNSRYTFSGWTASGVTLTATQKTAATLTFTMPANAVTLTASFTLIPPPPPPTITTQPQSRSVWQGEPVTFSVTAASQTSLSYQWNFNGKAIQGATGSSYTLPKTTAKNAGNYTVTIRNANGAVTSTVARLTVNIPVKPKLTAKPATKVETGLGKTVTLSVSASGNPPPTFQWLLNGNPVPGATSATLTIANVKASDLGKYSVVITSGPNRITSAVTTLEAILPPVIETPAASETGYSYALAAKGAKLSSKIAKNKAKPTYQWFLNGQPILGATKATYTAKADGAYSVRVTNGAGAVEKLIGNIKLITPPKFDAAAGLLAKTPAGVVTDKPEVVANVDQSVVFTAKLSAGTGPFTWTWFKNGKQVVRTHTGSSLTDTFTATNITAADKYSVQVESVKDAKGKPLAKAKSKTVAIKIVVPPQIVSLTVKPAGEIAPGKPATIAAKATGTAKLSYEWRGPDGKVIRDAKGAPLNKASLTLKPATNTATVTAGIYTVRVTNGAGDNYAATASVTVKVQGAPPPPAPPAAATKTASASGSARMSMADTKAVVDDSSAGVAVNDEEAPLAPKALLPGLVLHLHLAGDALALASDLNADPDDTVWVVVSGTELTNGVYDYRRISATRATLAFVTSNAIDGGVSSGELLLEFMTPDSGAWILNGDVGESDFGNFDLR